MSCIKRQATTTGHSRTVHLHRAQWASIDFEHAAMHTCVGPCCHVMTQAKRRAGHVRTSIDSRSKARPGDAPPSKSLQSDRVHGRGSHTSPKFARKPSLLYKYGSRWRCIRDPMNSPTVHPHVGQRTLLQQPNCSCNLDVNGRVTLCQWTRSNQTRLQQHHAPAHLHPLS